MNETPVAQVPMMTAWLKRLLNTDILKNCPPVATVKIRMMMASMAKGKTIRK